MMAGIVVLLALYVCVFHTQVVVSADPCLCFQEVDSGLKNPTIFASVPPASKQRVVVGQQDGVAYLYNKDWVRRPKPFLNMTGKAKVVVQGGNENGFRGLAFHPDFDNNRKLYIYYTIEPETAGKDSTAVISEFKTNSRKTKVQLSTERVILKLDQPQRWHNAGPLLFGCDGYLYIFFGDGGGINDPYNEPLGNGQDKSTLLGSVLRVDVSDDSVPYKIPPDNPFVNEPNSRPEIFAYGFRNPWRADIDEGDWLTGYGKCRIFTGDVGQATWEEINHVKIGGNYGWRLKEGKQCNPNSKFAAGCAALVGDTDPIHDYPRSWGRAVTGGHVYRGCRHPAFNGMYIFGDFSTGRMARLKETAPDSDVWEDEQLFACASDKCPAGTTNQKGSLIMGWGEDYDGELYLMTSESGSQDDDSGKVYKIVVPDRYIELPKLSKENEEGIGLINIKAVEIETCTRK